MIDALLSDQPEAFKGLRLPVITFRYCKRETEFLDEIFFETVTYKCPGARVMP
mgnify:CR=1 FL=1